MRLRKAKSKMRIKTTCKISFFIISPYDGRRFLFAVYGNYVPIVWVLSLPSYGVRFIIVEDDIAFAFLGVLELSSFYILKRRRFLLVCPFRRSYSPRIE